MRKEEIAWAAGILDGEGCITIIHVPANRQKGCITDRFTLHLKVTMGHRPTVERLFQIFKLGTVQNHVASTARVNSSFSWICQSRKAATVLRIVRPFLFTKAEEADVALKFMSLPLALTGGKGGNRPATKALTKRRFALYLKIRRLKSRWRFYESGFYKTRGSIVPIRLGLLR